MLVLTRKRAESIKIGNDIVIKVIHTSRGTVKLGIDAPAHVRVLRAELAEFTAEPAVVTNSNQPVVESENEDSSESMSDDGRFIEFRLDHDVEVEDLMVCVGAH
jgi:carbon storage regulator CsrA